MALLILLLLLLGDGGGDGGGCGGCGDDWKLWGVREGGGDVFGLVGVKNLVVVMENFGDEGMVLEVGFGEIGGGGRLLVVE